MLAGVAELELGCQEEGRGRRRHPRPTILQTQLSALGSPGGDRDRLAEARAVPRVSARRQDQGGNWRPSYLFLPHPSRPRTAPPSGSTTRSQRTRVRQRPGGAMLYASRLRALMHRFAKTGRRPSTARCRTDLGRQCDSAEEGAWPLWGVPSDASHTPRLGDRPTLSSDQGGQRPRIMPGLSPSGGPGVSRGRTHLWRQG